MAEPFQFELVSPERLLMSEPVDQVVVPGAEGYFTVLKGHAPFMSTLRPGVVDVDARRRRSNRIFVRGGFADVNADGLTILAEQAIPLAEVDAAMLAQEVKNAEEDVADAKDGATKDAAELRLSQLKEVQAALGRSPGRLRLSAYQRRTCVLKSRYALPNFAVEIALFAVDDLRADDPDDRYQRRAAARARFRPVRARRGQAPCRDTSGLRVNR